MKAKNRPLGCRLSGGVLTIEIGVDTLAFAALRSDYVFDLMGNDVDNPAERFRIDDKRSFARDVRRELLAEAENGSSMVTELLDKACMRAIEEGSTAFVDSKEEA